MTYGFDSSVARVLYGAVAMALVWVLWPSKKRHKVILVLGIHNAGKTCLTYMLRSKDFYLQLTPSRGIIMQGVFTIGKMKFVNFTDVGRPQIAHRASQANYYDGGKVDGVVYMIDAYDRERFPETKKELDALLLDESLASVPFLILGNKIDLPDAASEEELCDSIGLNHLTTGKTRKNKRNFRRPLEVFMCSFCQDMGYAQGFEWLSQYI